MAEDVFIEVDVHQACKHSQPVAGDVFLSRKLKEDDRIVSVLSDGLGSGVKANVLATLTSTMAMNFVARNTDIQQTAGIIMDTLPVCSERKIAYSTFTIVDIEDRRDVRIIEHDNPACLTIRNGHVLTRNTDTVELPRGRGNVNGNRELHFSNFTAQEGDRIIVCSDGVTQSGMGHLGLLLGWGSDCLERFACDRIASDPEISARDLARKIVNAAVANDEDRPMDDITCAVIYFRRPRRLLLVTGPPYAKQNDRLIAETVDEFPGRRVICGGTTAGIVARELGREISVDLRDIDPDIPPTSRMRGADLITEGTLTLARVVEMLEQGATPQKRSDNGATRIVDLFLNSDIIEFVVGTRINEAHQDPNTPVELDLRRNLMKRICRALEEKYLKETTLRFV
jgi:hypothetical protein